MKEIAGVDGSPCSLPWQRRAQPVLSAMTSTQPWSRVQLYSPAVVRVGNRYRMWYVGSNGETRKGTTHIGLAESDDGINWRPHEGNPVLRADDLPIDSGIYRHIGVATCPR